MRFLFRISVLLLAGWIAEGHAAPLTDGDYAYLKSETGLSKDAQLLRDLKGDEQSALHALINDSAAKLNPGVRDLDVNAFLFKVHIEQCRSWTEAHRTDRSGCPPGDDPNLEAGRIIAESRCNACHLFGAGKAPSFHQVASRRSLTEQELSAALASGHEMSPVAVNQDEIPELVKYIRSQK